MIITRARVAAALVFLPASLIAKDLKFTFAAINPEAGSTRVTPETNYDAQRGFGYLPGF
jgi:hypothetical protein